MLGRIRSRHTAGIADVPVDQLQGHIVGPDGVEDRSRCRRWGEDARRDPRCRRIGRQRRPGVAGRGNNDPRLVTRVRHRRTEPARLERGGRVDPFVLHVERPQAHLLRQRGRLDEWRRPFAEGHRRLTTA